MHDSEIAQRYRSSHGAKSQEAIWNDHKRKRLPCRNALLLTLCAAGLFSRALSQNSTNEIPLEHRDRLPVVKVDIAGNEMHLLVDTGATTILNVKSFAAGRSKQIHISSWTGQADTSAREVSLSSFSLGSHTPHDLKLPAIDLSPIGGACGVAIDGLLGVDLFDRLGVTIDLNTGSPPSRYNG